MLTSSLNKSPQPPIIVDDIIVNELNLGSTPPSLEILEVGDLAEDRFRGIFKVRYEGDAYLTLKTRVQANPLNTFLSTKPTFASPSPLAAGSGLTIPLQITLSDIRLSGFVILVFNRQKGITLVFRNDPLESLKVSSTFDSIPFVREYLQRTIEEQLRVLFMEDLPAIIHRLSLRAFNTEYQEPELEETSTSESEGQKPVDPFASPAQSAVDSDGVPIESPFFLDVPAEMYASFSQKNLLRLATLSESQRTLSLFTPSILDAVYRATASTPDRNLSDGVNTPLHGPTTLSRIQSTLNMSNTAALSSAASLASDVPSHPSRPSISSLPSMSTTYSLSSGRPRTRPTRKRKNRVVNLRRNRDDGISDTVSMSSGYEDSASRSESISADGSTNPISPEVSTVPTSLPATSVHPKEREGEVHTPNVSPKKNKKVDFERAHSTLDDVIAGAEDSATATLRPRPSTPKHGSSIFALQEEDPDQTPRASMYIVPEKSERRESKDHLPRMAPLPDRSKQAATLPRSASELSISDLVSAFPMHGGSSGGILEQAWMMKMATEIAKRVTEEKEKQGVKWQGEDVRGVGVGEEDGEAPPAYVS